MSSKRWIVAAAQVTTADGRELRVRESRFHDVLSAGKAFVAEVSGLSVLNVENPVLYNGIALAIKPMVAAFEKCGPYPRHPDSADWWDEFVQHPQQSLLVAVHSVRIGAA